MANLEESANVVNQEHSMIADQNEAETNELSRYLFGQPDILLSPSDEKIGRKYLDQTFSGNTKDS